MSLPLFTRATVQGQPKASVLKVVSVEGFLQSKYEPADCALWFDDSLETRKSRAASDVRWGAVITETAKSDAEAQVLSSCVVSNLVHPGVVAPGDVVRVNQRAGLLSVLHRRRSRTNSLLVTERCNSYCLMCSQPPIDRGDDSSNVDELLRIASLIDSSEQVLGITGGEPTLLRDRFVELLAGCRLFLPNTTLHVLTNGRTFADRGFATECARAAGNPVIWGVPLYTDVPEIHDFVVQRRGAFVETLQGLVNLAMLGQRVELRVVLQRATAPRLEQFAQFISRNLSFVDWVAWMGLEPMGFARPNWDQIWLDPSEYSSDLERAISILERADIPTSIYNLPLCVLPEQLWPFASQSISEWKNSFAKECDSCGARYKCGGLFVSASSKFLPGRISPLKKSDLTTIGPEHQLS